MSNALTTAQYLGRFRSELANEGIVGELADALTRDAFARHFADGMTVDTVRNSCRCYGCRPSTP